ncbi:hypothetical protein KPL71_008201 [Citrus sinensis]|uniref:Uncharacterized protein n=1 Tax=Citrus sinensis TaxID=2711 RepID=A0ACB8M524_CITSI|nr:hypothetical protein KPL71_008201 [Citrus sinensis]
MPLISPYKLYQRPNSFTRSIRTLISTKRPAPKEYIQSSRLDQCALQVTSRAIPPELVAQWKREGYTHLHLGGVRLILTLHGRKGLPVTARLALLDTRFKEYQHAVIGTVLTTLHPGSVLLTFYPNFNLSLDDPNLPTTLKAPICVIQIVLALKKKKMMMILIDVFGILCPGILSLPVEDGFKRFRGLQVASRGNRGRDKGFGHNILLRICVGFQRRKGRRVIGRELDETSPSQTEETSTDESFSTLDSEKELVGVSKLLMVQPSTGSNEPSPSSPPQTPIVEEADSDTNSAPHQENSPHKPSNGPWFTFDDIPRVKWPAIFQEFSAWIDVQMLRTGATTQTVLKEFSSCFTRSLRDWFESLASFPKEIQPELQRQFIIHQLDIANLSLGKIYHRCFISKKKGHFTRNCPNRPAKSVRLIEHLQDSMLLSKSDDVESFFSEQEDYDEQTTFVLAETDDHSESENVSVIQTVQQIQKVQSVIPILSIKIHLLSGKFDKPFPIIGFVDTRAQKSMLNPSILPSHFWEKHTEYFKAANGELFHRDLITKKPIGIQFFPECVLWTKLVGSNLLDKDLLIEFDVLHLVKKLPITASGIRYK